MIIVLHHNNSLIKILNEDQVELSFPSEKRLPTTLFSLAKTHPDELILWCNEKYFHALNISEIQNIFVHPKMMVSFATARKSYLTDRIGLVEDSPFIKINYDVPYPTWLMSSDVGGVHAQVLNALSTKDFQEKNIDIFLNSIAKIAMPAGLLCYSNPNLLKQNRNLDIIGNLASNITFYHFIKKHYKGRWVFFAFIAQLVFQKKFPIIPLFASLFYYRKQVDTSEIASIVIPTKDKIEVVKTIDVLIPTMGRKPYLYDVLKDLAMQTILPVRVIVVEQNAELNSKSELDFIQSESWPFLIKHHFIHQTGACNARNIAIEEVRSDWVFMADDDIRIPKDALERVFQFFEIHKAKVVTLSCLQVGEIEMHKSICQWNSFGSSCSVVSADLVKSTYFNMSLEHGFGEDMDYGMQLRNKGYDVLYNPNIELQHLKAPIGGFRSPIERPWDSEIDSPKPSPTIMLYRQNHTTPFQLKGYKLQLFIKFFKKQKVRNPFVYLKKMKKAWNNSVHWAIKLGAP